MKSFFVLSALLFISYTVTAQDNVTIKYYNDAWKECANDTATYISKVSRSSKTWSRKDYWIKGMQLQSEENFLDAEMKRRVDSSIYYNEKGVVIKRDYYENEKRAKLYEYYDNGNKKEIVFYAAGKPTQQTGWYENEIQGALWCTILAARRSNKQDGMKTALKYPIIFMNRKHDFPEVRRDGRHF